MEIVTLGNRDIRFYHLLLQSVPCKISLIFIMSCIHYSFQGIMLQKYLYIESNLTSWQSLILIYTCSSYICEKNLDFETLLDTLKQKHSFIWVFIVKFRSQVLFFDQSEALDILALKVWRIIFTETTSLFESKQYIWIIRWTVPSLFNL